MIQERAMLATLSISAWTARKQDKKVTREVESAHGAHDSGKFNKALVNKALLEPINKLTARIRESHYFATLPWADSGARLLPSVSFLDYASKIRTFKVEFDNAVDTMLGAYPSEVQAARVRLGSMYDPGDYPEAWELKDRFSIKVDFTPVPSAADFRVDLSEEAQADLRASVTSAVVCRQAEAVKAIYARVQEVVSKIAERLNDDKAIFKDSLITNAGDLSDILDGLNITNDPAITALALRIKKELLLDPARIRQSSLTRARVALAANDILASLPAHV